MRVTPVSLEKIKINKFNSRPLNFFCQRGLDFDSFEKKEHSKEISDKTFNEAKNLVMTTVLSSEPVESMALVQDDKIIDFTKGTSTAVIASSKVKDLLFQEGQNIRVIHSHPKEKSGCTLPVSFSDCRCMVSQDGVISVSAIDEKGHYSTIEKTPQFDPTAFDKYESDYRHSFSAVFDDSPEIKDLYEQVLKTYEEFVAFDDYDFEYINILRHGLNYYTQMGAGFKKAPLIIHEFWQKHAKDIGLVYTTDFEF